MKKNTIELVLMATFVLFTTFSCASTKADQATTNQPAPVATNQVQSSNTADLATKPSDDGPKQTVAASNTDPEPAKPAVVAPKTKIIDVFSYVLQTRQAKFADGMVSSSTKIQLDAQGRYLGEQVIGQDGATTLLTKATWSADGTVLTIKKLSNDGKGDVLVVTVQSFGAKGELLKEEIQDPQGAVVSSTENTYDDGGKLLQSVNKGSGKQLLAVTKYTWAKDLLAQTTVSDGNGKLLSTFDYAYDDHGQLVKKTETLASGKVRSVIAYAWKDGKLLTEDQFYNGVLQRSLTYQYGDIPKPVGITTKDRSGQVLSIDTLAYLVLKSQKEVPVEDPGK